MNYILKIILFTHIGSGFISLILFWIPALSKKGGLLHRKSGKLYVIFMWISLLTSLILSVKNFIQGYYTTAALLSFLAILTAQPLWNGISILKNKHQLSESYYQIRQLSQGLLFVSSLCLLIYAFTHLSNPMISLLFIFGILGLSSIKDLFTSLDQMQKNSHWLLEHVGSMIVTGIAAHTAFFAFGGRKIFSGILEGHWMILPWVLPTVIGVGIIQYYKKKYKKNKA